MGKMSELATERDKISELLAERAQTHGDYTVTAYFSQQFKATARKSPNWSGGQLGSPHLESVDMILHKLARILCGDPDHEDSWRDISGYAQLVCDYLKLKKEQPF